MTIGERILQLRKKRGLSQGALADHLDVSRQSVSKWETGRAIPDVDKIVKLSEFFQVTVDYLAKDNDNLENEQAKSEYKQKSNELVNPRNKTPGYILIATGLLLVGISLIFTSNAALLLGIIVFIIGLEWVLVKRNLSLVIAWTILLISVCIFNPWTTGSTTGGLIHAVMSGTFSFSIIAIIIQRIYGIILLFVTVKLMISHVK